MLAIAGDPSILRAVQAPARGTGGGTVAPRCGREEAAEVVIEALCKLAPPGHDPYEVGENEIIAKAREIRTRDDKGPGPHRGAQSYESTIGDSENGRPLDELMPSPAGDDGIADLISGIPAGQRQVLDDALALLRMPCRDLATRYGPSPATWHRRCRDLAHLINYARVRARVDEAMLAAWLAEAVERWTRLDEQPEQRDLLEEARV